MKVAVIRFTPAATDPPDWRVRLEASRISAEQKIKSFEHLGFRADHVVLPPGVGRGEFREVLEGYNADPATRAIIVQFPPPRDLAPVVDGMDPAKDIDALLKGRTPYPACATAEGIYRVAEPFATDRPAIVVVGSKGFVGQGVVTMLRADGHDPMTLDLGDRLERVRDADIVISVTGSPGILTPDLRSAGRGAPGTGPPDRSPAPAPSPGRRWPVPLNGPGPAHAGGRPPPDLRGWPPSGVSTDSLTGCTDRSRSPPAGRPGRSRCRTASSRCRRSRRPSTSRPWPPRSARPGCCGSGTDPYRPG